MKFTFDFCGSIIMLERGGIMSTIFPREEKAEQIFDRILTNPNACERLKNTFFEAIPSAEESEGAGTDITGTVFAAALFNAYENKDLSAFLMAVCNNSVFDLLRNSFLIPIRFNDKGVENPVLLTDDKGNLLNEFKNHLYEKKYKMFHKLYEEQDEIPDYQMYMADGFRENHSYTDSGEIVTEKISKHTGILLMFRFPESVKLDINEDRIYAVVWDFLMRLQEELPRALMYYGVRDEEGREKNTATLGIFLPFHHFERKMEKNIEIANGIGLGCREYILAEINRQAGK